MAEEDAVAKLRSEHARRAVTVIDFGGSPQVPEAEMPQGIREEPEPGTPEFAAKCRELDHRSLRYRFLKRLFDVLFSLCVIVVGLVPCALLSIAIAIDTKGSPIYSQIRVGKWGKPFRIYKFRTMVADGDNVSKYFTPEQLEVWKRERKVDGDPRVTRLGRVLRATSFDEVAQFVNVLFGQIPLRILKTRRGFSVKMLGAFALPARLARTRIAAFLQVRGAIYAIVGVPQNLFEYSIAGYGKMRGIFAKRDSRIEFPLLGRFMLVPCNGFPI